MFQVRRLARPSMLFLSSSCAVCFKLSLLGSLFLISHLFRELLAASFRICVSLTCVPAALKQAELEDCVRWMVPFAMVLRELGGLPLKKFSKIPSEDMHNIQTHAPYVSWLVRNRAKCRNRMEIEILFFLSFFFFLFFFCDMLGLSQICRWMSGV